MKLSVILVSFLVGFISLNQSFAEVYTTGSAADNNGNIIVIGYCLGNVNICGEQYSITTPSAFILKLNSDGEKIWVRFINSTQSIKANAVAVDSSGNIYITGEFSGTANFGSNSLFAQNADAFIIKLNVDGEVEWVKHGTSPSAVTGRDIFVNGEQVFVCGFGNPIAFDSLSTSGGGFTVKINLIGTIIDLFNTLDNSYNITLDLENNIIICGGEWEYVYHYYVPQLGKFTNQGGLIWKYDGVAPSNVSTKFFPATDDSLNIYTALQMGQTTFLSKSNRNGVTITPLFYYLNFSATEFRIKDEGYFLLTGDYLNNAQFGDSVLMTNGAKDAYIAKLDTGFNPVWIKRGGGKYGDELTGVSLMNDDYIISTSNFRGSIEFENINYTGGTGPDDQWAALIKFDEAGNVLWLKKIGENYAVQDSTNWLPMYAENIWHFYVKNFFTSVNQFQWLLHQIAVLDSSTINNKKYYSVDGFFEFSSGTKIRFDFESQRILVLLENAEHTFMDFSKSQGEFFEQIQPNGSILNVKVISEFTPVIFDTVMVKGFYKDNIGEGRTGWYFFAPNVGFVWQDEQAFGQLNQETDLYIIEYRIFDPHLLHVKHTNQASILFNPVYFVSDTNRIIQYFEILHPYSKLSVSNFIYGFSYIKNAYLQSFYFNGVDTIWNNNFNIPQTTEIDFSLDYQFDTTKYNHGYHLYYRIAAVDKGIVADTFYSPTDGYYKLFWKDSTTSVTQTEFEALTYSLSQNYPNPFNPVSKIVFTIPKRDNVSLKVYDILGSEITTLVNKELDAGKYEVDFSGKDLSSGIYIYQIKAGAFRDTKKMILMR